MKELFKNNKKYSILIIVIALVYIVMIFKSGIGIIYRYEIDVPGSSNGWTPDVLPHANGVLIDNLLIMLAFICLLALAILLGKNKKAKLIILIIFIIVSTIFIPVKVSMHYFGKNDLIINTDKNDVSACPIFNIFDL